MANKANYYGLATKEQRDKREAAFGHPEINKQELTETSIYSAMAQIPNVDLLSAQVAANRIKDILMKQGFQGDITTAGAKLSDGVNTFALTKNKEYGIHIGSQTHDDLKRRKRK